MLIRDVVEQRIPAAAYGGVVDAESGALSHRSLVELDGVEIGALPEAVETCGVGELLEGPRRSTSIYL